MMGVQYTDNWDVVRKAFRQIEVDTGRVHVAVIKNHGPGIALQDWSGYFIFHNKKLEQYVAHEVQRQKHHGKTLNHKYTEAAIERAVVRYINFLRSTSGVKPPIEKGGPWRPRHQGRWADVSGFTDNAYEYQINNSEWKADPEWKAGLSVAKGKWNQVYPNRPMP